jgi:hypothetical protein
MQRKNVKEWSGSLEASRVLPMLKRKTIAVHLNTTDAPVQALEASLPLNIGNRIRTRQDETTRSEMHQKILSWSLILNLRSTKVVERAAEI